MSVTPNLCKVSIFREGSFRRDSAITTHVACDWTNQLKDSFPWAEPKRKRTSYRYIGGGRNVGRVVELGFEPGESSIEFQLLTGIFLYYALGGVITRGANSVFTGGTVTATALGTNSVTLTIDSSTATVPDGLEGSVLIYTNATTSRVYTYYVIDSSNAANTVTIYAFDPDATATMLNGQSVDIENGAYTHTISEENTLPSFTLHLEQTLDGEEIYVDLTGCLVKELTITMEAGSDTPVMCSVSLIVAKEITGNALGDPDPAQIEEEFYIRSHLETLSLTYNGAEFDDDLINQCDKVTWTVTNEIDLKAVLGDQYPKKVLVGAREYKLLFHPYIRTNLWHTVSRLQCPNYASYYGTGEYYLGPIATSFTLRKDPSTYLSISHTHLLMESDLEYAHPSWEDKELGIDINFSQAPLDTVSVVVGDTLSPKYYEVAST